MIGKIQWLLMAAEHRLACVGFWEAFQGSEGFPEGSLDVLLTSVGAAVIKGLFRTCVSKPTCKDVMFLSKFPTRGPKMGQIRTNPYPWINYTSLHVLICGCKYW